MTNLLILGSGRSGTSMLTGMLQNSGYHFGKNFNYLKKNRSNLKGFFEDKEVNTVNEDILRKNLVTIPEFFRKRYFSSFTFYRARWLSVLPTKKSLVSNDKINNRINSLIKVSPFCYKDPRFSYTLPIWKSVMDANAVDVKYLVIYREPNKTAESIERECKENRALNTLKMTPKRALKVWGQMYKHILKNYNIESKKENWMFLHFDQLFIKEKVLEIEDFIGSKLDNSFPEKSISRSKGFTVHCKKSQSIYNKLNILSGYSCIDEIKYNL